MMQALGGVAVIADSTYAAFQGKKKLKVEWTKSEHDVWTSDAFRKDLEATARKPCKVVRENGNVDEAFAKGGKIVEAEYYAPMLAHAAMEPPAALAVYRDGKVEAWAPTQNPQGAQEAIGSSRGREERRCDRARDAARRRVWPKIVSRILPWKQRCFRRKRASR